MLFNPNVIIMMSAKYPTDTIITVTKGTRRALHVADRRLLVEGPILTTTKVNSNIVNYAILTKFMAHESHSTLDKNIHYIMLRQHIAQDTQDHNPSSSPYKAEGV